MAVPSGPGPGEQFVMQWRVQVDEVIGHPLALYDPGVALVASGWSVSILLGTDVTIHPFAAIVPGRLGSCPVWT
jgi:hypothetical protein